MLQPVLVLRNVTERPEGVEAGTLKLAGTDEKRHFIPWRRNCWIIKRNTKNGAGKEPFGDGTGKPPHRGSILYAFGKKQNPMNIFWCIKYEKHLGGKPMKEERMAILNMLEKGIISVDEAERLLTKRCIAA